MFTPRYLRKVLSNSLRANLNLEIMHLMGADILVASSNSGAPTLVIRHRLLINDKLNATWINVRTGIRYTHTSHEQARAQQLELLFVMVK